MMELTDNVTEVIKIIVDATSDAVVKKMKPVIEKPSCDDCISRQAVLDTISELNAISFYEAQEDSKECYHEIKKAIEALSPTTPKAKVGKWIRQKSYSGYTHTYECSECGRTIYAEDDDLTDFPYCHCGAKMESEG